MARADDVPICDKPNVGGKRFRVRRVAREPLDTMGYQGFDTRDDAIGWAEQSWSAGDVLNVIVSERMMIDGREVWVVVWSLPLI